VARAVALGTRDRCRDGPRRRQSTSGVVGGARRKKPVCQRRLYFIGPSDHGESFFAPRRRTRSGRLAGKKRRHRTGNAEGFENSSAETWAAQAARRLAFGPAAADGCSGGAGRGRCAGFATPADASSWCRDSGLGARGERIRVAQRCRQKGPFLFRSSNA